MAQLAINRLEIPPELQITIKDYVWPDKERKRIMNYKIGICNKIKGAYSPVTPSAIIHDTIWWFEVDHRQFQAHFCKCGEFSLVHQTEYILCKC